MKLLFLTNNEITKPLIEWLEQRAKEEVVLCSGKLTLSYVKSLSPYILISYNYRHIVTEDIINLMNGRIINLHISLLPWNRGADPNLWSFLEETPKGVTVHLIDKGIDTGDILLQEEIRLNEHTETLESSYKKLHAEIQKLFITNWDAIKNFEISPKPQFGKGSFHRSKDSAGIKSALGERLWSIPIYELKQKLKDASLV
jgi:methionyl-tRNA formyltransferase